MRLFKLNRLIDETGISGTGIVAEGVCFSSGMCVLQWLTGTSSIAIYNSIESVEEVHGHGGKTVIEYVDWVDYDSDSPMIPEHSDEH